MAEPFCLPRSKILLHHQPKTTPVLREKYRIAYSQIESANYISDIEHPAVRAVLAHLGAKSKCLNVEKLIKVLPDFTMQPLDAGLERTISWFFEAGAYK